MQQTRPECRIITVQQPWADFLVPDGGIVDRVRETNPGLADRLPKDIENRTFGTDWRGPLLILAAGRRVDEIAMARYGLDRNRYILGVVTDSTSTWAVHGARHWQVDNPIRLLSPPPAAGFLGIRLPEQRLWHEVFTRLERQRQLEVGTP